jgi:hypothetical protein
MTTEESRNGSVHGDATNEIFQFYQPHYTDFHRTNLFKLNMSKPESITQADVDEVNAVLRKMYDAETPELRRVRLLNQLDSGLHSAMQETFVNSVKSSKKFHKVFFVRQPELFLAIMNINNRYVKVNCEKICKDQSVERQGEFSFELQQVSEFSARYDSVPARSETRGPSVTYHAENDGYTQVNYRRPRDTRRDTRDTRDERNDSSTRQYRSRVYNRDERRDDRREPSYRQREGGNRRRPNERYNRTDDSRYTSDVHEESKSTYTPSESVTTTDVDKVESFVKELKLAKTKTLDEVFETPTSGSSWATMTEEDENRRLEESRE